MLLLPLRLRLVALMLQIWNPQCLCLCRTARPLFCLQLRFDYTAIKALISAIRLNNLFSTQKKRRNSQHSEKRARETARCKQLFVGLVAGGQ